ncbi:hypothetical protein DYQ86_00840 [Acidobacteria bacterium AB60]|nr:hypothetical protein DYQ86_00840 [Acidobacteria bacterium AB60]
MVYLWIADSTVHCRSDGTDPGWSIRVSDIVLVAEYTTDSGPAVDDYFLVFVTRESGELFYSSVTMSAAGINTVLEDLEKQLGGALEMRLTASRRWASRVVWPPHLVNVEYLEAEEPPEPEGLAERLMRKFRGAQPEYRVADRILQALTVTRPVA